MENIAQTKSVQKETKNIPSANIYIYFIHKTKKPAAISQITSVKILLADPVRRKKEIIVSSVVYLNAFNSSSIKLFFECGINMPQDVGTPLLLLQIVFDPYIISIAVHENVPPTQKPPFPHQS
jgi:hypothetical protein